MRADSGTTEVVHPLFASREMTSPIPRYEIADGGMSRDAAYQLIHDELSLDGNPMLNLASFVTTWMDEGANDLMAETLSKNYIDQEEYPITSELERRCVSIVADLFNAPSTGTAAVGTATIGSSEAIHLAGLAMKKRWGATDRGSAPGAKPNLVMSTGVHVTWEKFCRYFDVEPRMQPYADGRYVIDADAAMALVDENTIGVVGILGTTYTGAFEPISELDSAIRQVNSDRGFDVPVHVDAASGGFVAPFVYPDLEWDFRLESVKSINTSGHKYGLVYPGIGWAIWRSAEYLPDELIFRDSYLGAEQETFDLNFSRGAGGIVGQYYNFIRLGRSGYTEVMQNLLDTTSYLAKIFAERDRLEAISGPGGLPLYCAKTKSHLQFNAHDVVAKLRERGWIVPAYTMPPAIDDWTVVRVVVREGFNRDLADLLVADTARVADSLRSNPPAAPAPHRRSKARTC